MKTTTVVEFSKKEIQDMLVEKARQVLNAGQSTSNVCFEISGHSDTKVTELTGAKVTFENLQPKGK